MNTEKTPPVGAGGSTSQSKSNTHNRTTRRRGGKFWTKKRRVLLNLIRRPSLHRFQAERIGEHCLHSTVAAWQAHGLQIAREFIQVEGWGGEPTTVARYYLTPDQREAALDLLARELQAAALADSYEDAVRFLTSGDREAA